MSNYDGLDGEDIIASEQCDFQQSAEEDIRGELVLTQKGVIFLRITGKFRTSREYLHSYEYQKIERCSRKDITLILKVKTAQNVVTFKYRTRKHRAGDMAQVIRKEMKRIKRENEKLEAEVRAEKKKRKAEEKARRNEERRKHQVASSIEILEESTLPNLEKQLDGVALKSTDLMVHEFDFLKFEVSENHSVVIEFAVLESTPSYFDMHIFLDHSSGITSTLSGGVSGFQPIEALLSETKLGMSKLVGFRALKDLSLCLIIYKYVTPKGQYSVHVKVGNVTSSE